MLHPIYWHTWFLNKKAMPDDLSTGISMLGEGHKLEIQKKEVICNIYKQSVVQKLDQKKNGWMAPEKEYPRNQKH